MRVVFVQDVTDVANVGDVKTVANGYARNYLMPRKLAVPATPQELKRLEERKKAEERKEAKLGTKAGDLAGKISEATVILSARAGAGDRLYGAITNSHVADELTRLIGEPIDRRKIRLEDPIRRLGEYDLEVRLTKDVSATVTVIVHREGTTPPTAKKAEEKTTSAMATQAQEETEAENVGEGPQEEKSEEQS